MRMLLHILPLAVLAACSPAPIPQDPVQNLSPRAPSPGLIEDLLQGVLSPVGDLIKDILDKVTSAQSDEIGSKPVPCLESIDPCCKCTYQLSYYHSSSSSYDSQKIQTDVTDITYRV